MMTFSIIGVSLFIFLYQPSNGQKSCYYCPNLDLNLNPSNCLNITCLDSQVCCQSNLTNIACCEQQSTLDIFSTTSSNTASSRPDLDSNTKNVIIIVCVIVGLFLIITVLVLIYIFKKPFNRRARSIYPKKIEQEPEILSIPSSPINHPPFNNKDMLIFLDNDEGDEEMEKSKSQQVPRLKHLQKNISHPPSNITEMIFY